MLKGTIKVGIILIAIIIIGPFHSDIYLNINKIKDKRMYAKLTIGQFSLYTICFAIILKESLYVKLILSVS